MRRHRCIKFRRNIKSPSGHLKAESVKLASFEHFTLALFTYKRIRISRHWSTSLSILFSSRDVAQILTMPILPSCHWLALEVACNTLAQAQEPVTAWGYPSALQWEPRAQAVTTRKPAGDRRPSSRAPAPAYTGRVSPSRAPCVSSPRPWK